MPFSQSMSTMGVRNEVKQRLKQKLAEEQASGRHKGVTLNTYLNLLLLEVLEQDDYLKKYGPFLSWIGVHENLLLVHDYALQKTIDVEVHDDKKILYCREHRSSDCVHVGFCFAIPDVYKVLVERGFKQPKVKK